MKKLLLLCLLVSLAAAALAQEEGAKPQKPATPATPMTAAYKLNLTISELENGKRVSTHSFAMDEGAGEWGKLRLGSRVPISRNGQINYIDVGFNIDTRVRESEAGDVLDLTVDMSSIVGEQKSGEGMQPPVVRQYRYSTVTLLSPNKPTLINAADDPVSNRRLEIEVTANKAK